jgi:hypothetical protein
MTLADVYCRFNRARGMEVLLLCRILCVEELSDSSHMNGYLQTACRKLPLNLTRTSAYVHFANYIL